MTKAAKLKPFKVVKTPKIRDDEDKYVKRGGIAMLGKASAEHYHSLGYIQISMEGIFDGQEPNSPEPDSEAGKPDEGSASKDAEADAGEGETKTTPRMEAISRRRRAAS